MLWILGVLGDEKKSFQRERERKKAHEENMIIMVKYYGGMIVFDITLWVLIYKKIMEQNRKVFNFLNLWLREITLIWQYFVKVIR